MYSLFGDYIHGLAASTSMLAWSPVARMTAALITSNLQARAVEYQFAHERPLNVGATAQLLSNTLYYKRFFPYYTANLCVGLDPQGADFGIQSVCTRLSRTSAWCCRQVSRHTG